MALIRVFFALPISDSCAKQLVQTSKHLKALLPTQSLRWFEPDNYHVTMAFLGNVEQSAVPALERIARLTVAEFTARDDLHFTGIQWFPKASKPKVLALQVAENKGLLELQKTLMTALGREGFKADRREFRPHLTLARCGRSSIACGLMDDGIVLSSPIDSLVLFASDLTPKGPIYTPLFSTAIVGC